MTEFGFLAACQDERAAAERFTIPTLRRTLRSDGAKTAQLRQHQCRVASFGFGGLRRLRPTRLALEVSDRMDHVIALDVEVEQALVEQLGSALDARVPEPAAQIVDRLVEVLQHVKTRIESKF